MTLAVVSLGLPTFLAAPPASSSSLPTQGGTYPSLTPSWVLSPSHISPDPRPRSHLPTNISAQMSHKPFQLSQSQRKPPLPPPNSFPTSFLSFFPPPGLNHPQFLPSPPASCILTRPVTGVSTTCPFVTSPLETGLHISAPGSLSLPS